MTQLCHALTYAQRLENLLQCYFFHSRPLLLCLQLQGNGTKMVYSTDEFKLMNEK